MKKLIVLLLAASPLFAQSKLANVKDAIITEARRYGRDAKEMALAPKHWSGGQWARFAEGSAAVAALYAADKHLYDDVQRNRTSFTDNFAKAVTPLGGGRAEQISVALILGGLWMHDANARDAGRDSLEAEILAGGVVTPLLKRAFGRARPVQGQGASSFHPFASNQQSFPSGHATNAFAFATAIAGHYDGWVVPTVVYTIATGVAFSRVNDRAHFPSDVLAGALIGRAVAKGVVYRHRQGKAAWQLTPAWINHGPAVAVHLVTR